MAKLVRLLAKGKATWAQIESFRTSADFNPDLLKSMDTQECGRLSVYAIGEAGDLLPVVIAAMGAAPKKASLDQVDFCVFEEKLLDELGIPRFVVPGETPCRQVRDAHRDIELTGISLHELVKALVWGRGEFARWRRPEVASAISTLARSDEEFRTAANQKILQDAAQLEASQKKVAE